jgi:hypothetical protein
MVTSIVVFQINILNVDRPNLAIESINPSIDNSIKNSLGDPLGDKGIWIVDLLGYGNTIVLDGDLSDWNGIPHDTFKGVDTYLAYDTTYVYVAATWEDTSNDGEISCWNKTGHINDTHGIWDELVGGDDMLSIGFSNGSYTDMWIWANSIRGDTNYAYETDAAGTPDSGTLPYLRNEDPSVENQPGFDNSTIPITDHTAISNGTVYVGWFDSTPSGSQTDVLISQTWNASGDGKYVIEFRRLLDTGSYTDDIKLDFSVLTDQSFYVDVANKYDALDFDISTYDLSLAAGNEPSEFEVDPIVNPVTSFLLVTGKCYDDYGGFDLLVHLSGWNETYDPNHVNKGDVNWWTGDWSCLLYFNEQDMPIGDHVITVIFSPNYEETIVVKQNITIDDINPPQIVGIVDIDDIYPSGVPNGTEYVTVTVGVSDNYDPYDYLIVQLYHWRGNDVAWMTIMDQFAPGSPTFSGNITLGYASTTISNNYTYFIQVWDTNHNKAISEWHSFILGDKPPASTPPSTPTTPTTSIELGIPFIGGLIVGTIALSIISYRSIKKINRQR